MNAFLNTNICGFGNSILPGLRTDVPMDMGQYVNFMTPSFCSGGASPIANAINNIPFGNNSNMFGSVHSVNNGVNVDALNNLLEKGIITKEEYKNKLREMNGFFSNETEVNPFDMNGGLASLSDEKIEKAQQSNKGEFKVTDAHKEIANHYIDAAKEILKKSPSEINHQELAALQTIFEEVNKNPMLADAFIQKANKVSFSSEGGKTSTLLGSYEQALTKTLGQKEAKKQIAEVKGALSKNVSGRNAEAFEKFETENTKDASNIKYTASDKFGEKLRNNPMSTATLGIAAGGLGLYGLTKGGIALTKAVGVKGLLKAGKYGVLAAAALAIGVSAYNLFIKKD